MEAKIFSDLFQLDISIVEKIVRPVIVYFFLVAGLRLAGKRELAQLNPFDLVVLLTLSNTVQNAIIGNDNSVTGGLIGATTLLVLNYVVVRFLFKHPKLDRLVEGNSDLLIEGGKINSERLNKELITIPELKAAAHKQGFDSLDQVDRATLEPGGTFSFFAKETSPEKQRHDEVLSRLEQMSRDLASLRASLQR